MWAYVAGGYSAAAVILVSYALLVRRRGRILDRALRGRSGDRR